MASGCDFGDHDLGVTIPRADEQAVIHLVELLFAQLVFDDTPQMVNKDLTYPEFPAMMETKFLCPDAYHTPAIEEDNCDGNGVKHSFGAEFKALLNEPETIDPHCLLLMG